MIKDNNLKLMLIESIESLTTKHRIGWDNTYEEFCLANFGRNIDFDWDSYEINTKVESFLLDLELPKEDLLTVKQITLDGDYFVFCLLTEDFLVQEEYFYIKSLEGIQNCKNLKYLNLGTMTQGVNLQPLAHLLHLEKVTISSYNATNYNALLSIKNLKALHIYNWATFSDTDKIECVPVLKQLKERGCELVFSPPTKWETV